MAKLAIIEHVYIFDPADTWSNVSGFDKSLNEVLGNVGLQAERQVIPAGGKQYFFISKVPQIVPVPETNEPSKSPQQILNEMKRE